MTTSTVSPLSSVKTRILCRPPLTSCMVKAQEMIAAPGNWSAINPEQAAFLRHWELRHELSKLTPEELESMASMNADEVTAWLAERGFTLKCPPIPGGGFATASVLKMLMKWDTEGEKTTLEVFNGTTVPAVYFDNKDQHTGKRITHRGRTYDMCVLFTKDKDTQFYIAMPEHPLDDNDETLVSLVSQLQNEYRYHPQEDYQRIYVPMLDVDITEDHVWMAGLRYGTDWFVDKCLQQSILKLNEKGATAKSAAVMVMKRGVSMPKPVLKIDKPFLAWVSRSGMTFSPFVAYCGLDSWKEPTDLD